MLLRDRAEETERCLDALDPGTPSALENHGPLAREATRIQRAPHIPRNTWDDRVRFEKVSVGAPRERCHRTERPRIPDHPVIPRQILPAPWFPR